MRHRARARVQAALACAALLATAPATALAGSDPVHVDPKSPVAKEYAIPLATARGAAPESGQTGALFGSGIASSRHTTTSTVTPPQPTAPTAAAPPATSARPAPGAPPAVVTHNTVQAIPSADKVLEAGSGSGLEWMLLAGVAVIALGSAGGFLLRRR